MSDLLFSAPDWPLLTMRGSERRIPVRRVFCVGRNYAAHAAEMGNEVDREAPFYFTKSALAVLPCGPEGVTMAYPPGTSDLHHEVELAVILGAPAFRVPEAEAMSIVAGYACALDMTRRDLQAKAKDKRRPWSLGKDFEDSAIIGDVTPAADWGAPGRQAIKLSVDGTVRQESQLDLMVWSVAALIADLSGFYHLQPGDVILTGTPEGVGAVEPGARLTGSIEGLAPLDVTIA
ncbi:FAA hydrolase family protein [Paracoccus suum]|uniref:FAA hydrolase family protein n=2 Tax=Paracoccus suum TaxID=2259340 RepID=A0A344PNV9_9RHOB|nr:fumarylacetoacetate hydrolase family protein [Paracoccus suum]AXC51064.1 FAA hydrolase family protein [Paracoccus suum]